MRLEHHLVGGYVRYISPYIIIIIKVCVKSMYCQDIKIIKIIREVKTKLCPFKSSRRIMDN